MPTDAIPDLRTLLEHDITLVSAFITLLQDEAAVLASGAQDNTLTKITAEKRRYIKDMESQTAKRNKLLTALGYSPDKTGLQAAMADHPVLFDSAHSLLQQTAHASILNTGNGHLINRFLNHNQAALDALKSLIGHSDLYDASGRKRTAAPRNATHIKAC